MRADAWDRLCDGLYVRRSARIDRAGAPAAEAAAAARLAGLEPGADVLDCPCGYGRHSIPLARAGYHVVGADRSPALLEEARRRAGQGEWPKWVEADHRELPFADGSFDAVFNLFSSLGYRGEEGDRRTLSGLRRVLRPGGALVVETMHRDRLARIFLERLWDPLPDGGMVVEEHRFDQVSGVMENDFTLVDAAGARESVTYRIRTYTVTELVRLVEEAGFTGIDCYGGPDGQELGLDTPP